MKKWITLVIASVIISSSGIIATATSAPSLDELIGQSQASSEAPAHKENSGVTSALNGNSKNEGSVNKEYSGSGTYESNKSFIDALKESTDHTKENPQIIEAAKVMGKAVGYFVQGAACAITLALSVLLLFDLFFIIFPFIRGFMVPANTQGSQASITPRTQIGGFGGPQQGGFGGFGGMSPVPGPTQSANNAPNRVRNSLVSNYAIKAVENEGNIDANGKKVRPLVIYVSEMIKIMIWVPILLTLISTGVLSNLGFQLGALLVQGISSINTMI